VSEIAYQIAQLTKNKTAIQMRILSLEKLLFVSQDQQMNQRRVVDGLWKHAEAKLCIKPSLSGTGADCLSSPGRD
jgi:hypothetical protein